MTLLQQISTIIKSYVAIFKQPQSLPPTRQHDHHILILPHTSPVNAKPHGYPHSQKEAMTIIIQDMLQ